MDVLDTVGKSKVWSYVALAGGVLALAGIAILVKEKIEADKTVKIKEAVKEDAEALIAESGLETSSECGGCSSANGKDFPFKQKRHQA